MSRCYAVVVPILAFLFTENVVAQNSPASTPQALLYAAQSIASVSGRAKIVDATLTGTVTWNGIETGNATLKVVNTGKSRIDLQLATGTRSEIRGEQNGLSMGRWAGPNRASGNFASHNCWTDAAWFFPAFGSLASGPSVVLSYIGQEARDNIVVQHIRSNRQVLGHFPHPSPQELSTMDFYLDAATLLPAAVKFNAHPDNDALTNLPIEIDFSDYQTFNGVVIPTHIRKYQQGNLLIDLTITQASFNTGLSF